MIGENAANAALRSNGVVADANIIQPNKWIGKLWGKSIIQWERQIVKEPDSNYYQVQRISEVNGGAQTDLTARVNGV